MTPYRTLFDKVLTRVDAETAHRLGFRALRAGRPLVGHAVPGAVRAGCRRWA